MRKQRNRRGVALVLVLFAMVVIGALVAGAFFVGRTEQVTGYNTVSASQASAAAEAGVAHAVSTVDAVTYQALPVWTSAVPTELVISQNNIAGSNGVAFVDSIRRLNSELYLIRSTGQRLTAGGNVLASQTLAQLVRIAKPTIGVNAAVTVQDPIKFNGNAFYVDGINEYPAQWSAGDCPTGGPDAGNTDDVVGIRSSTTTGAGSNDMDNIGGYPSKTVDNDPTITSDTFRDFLDYTYNTLSSQPNVKKLPNTSTYNGIAPVLDGTGACDKTVLLNFGEPYRNPPTAGAVTACTNYFPVVNGTGSSTKFAAGNRGQGILLIDGDMELVGGFEWVGLIIVRGQMKVTGTGNKITGAILTEGVDINTAGSVGGNVEVQYSRCAIDRAVNGSAIPLPLSRGWAQLYQ